jgi:UDP-glucose 4-epimerase
MSTKVLVTGGAGYIGSHACKALAAAGFIPVTLDNLVHGHERAVKWGPFVKGDLADKALLLQTLRDHEVAAVMHFAAYAYVGESMDDPGKYFRNNVTNTINLLDTMVETGVGRIVFSSTCATYGVPDEVPIGEDHPHGIRAYALRYFNAAGADPDGEIGEDHDPETHLIPLVIQAALGQRDNVKIFGTDYDTPDGSAVRDYIHVTDLAEAHVSAISRLLEGGDSQFLNLGTGTGHSVKDVVSAVERISGLQVNAIEAPRRAGDPPILVAKPGAAAEVLGWIPRHSDLEAIVATALRWHQQQAVGAALPGSQSTSA